MPLKSQLCSLHVAWDLWIHILVNFHFDSHFLRLVGIFRGFWKFINIWTFWSYTLYTVFNFEHLSLFDVWFHQSMINQINLFGITAFSATRQPILLFLKTFEPSVRFLESYIWDSVETFQNSATTPTPSIASKTPQTQAEGERGLMNSNWRLRWFFQPLEELEW